MVNIILTFDRTMAKNVRKNAFKLYIFIWKSVGAGLLFVKNLEKFKLSKVAMSRRLVIFNRYEFKIFLSLVKILILPLHFSLLKC